MTLLGNAFAGYLFTAAMAITLPLFIASVIASRKELKELLSKAIGTKSIIALIGIVAFFIAFSLLYVHPVNQLYFDESIYQGIALNILHHGNAEWCNYGTAFLGTCPSSILYHDPVGWAFFIAMAFAIFGQAGATAYGLQLLTGAVSIIAVFLLSAGLFRKPGLPVLSALFMAVNPMLYIWSRTQAVVNLPFMMFTTFTFLLFALFIKYRNVRTMSAFLFSLCITIYMRGEAILLFPIFAFLYLFAADSSISDSITSIPERINHIFSSRNSLIVIAVFALLCIPEIAFAVQQFQHGSFGQTSTGLFSTKAFLSNIKPNVLFFLGMLNQKTSYPAVFPVEVLIMAVFGAVLLVANPYIRERFAVLLMLGAWIIPFHLFYDFFYAGSVLYGVDSRFMLQILPPLAILASLGVYGMYDLVDTISKIRSKIVQKTKLRKRRPRKHISTVAFVVAIAMVCAFAIYPFIALAPNITMLPSQMPQQKWIFGMVNFIHGNSTLVPSNCLVFTFTPDVWYMLNRSAMQVEFFRSGNPQAIAFESQFSCFVFDRGYWCNTQPYSNSTCSYYINTYPTNVIASSLESTGFGPALYRLSNYTPVVAAVKNTK